MPERLTRNNFTKQREQGTIVLSFIGMSNVGKSHWSNRLRNETEFQVVGCDDQIEACLGEELSALGYAGGMTDVGRWMGQPYDPQFPDTQKRYLQLEAEVTTRALDAVENGYSGSNVVIDTTGSVVHLDSAIQQRMHDLTTVVYLEATLQMQAEMFKRFSKHPKPLVWGDSYRRNAGESREDSLRRLYPELLARRSALYSGIAHVTFTQEEMADMRDSEDFLEHIRCALSAS